jgi:hypothetical protein
MFWLLKRIFGLGVLIALVFLVLQFQVGGRPLKDYLIDFYRSPLVQEAFRQGKEAVTGYLQKDVTKGPEEAAPAMDRVSDEEREELEKVLEKETRSK